MSSKAVVSALKGVEADFDKYDVLVSLPVGPNKEPTVARLRLMVFQDIYSGCVLSWRVHQFPIDTDALYALDRLALIRAMIHEAKSAREAARSTENLDIADGHWERFDQCMSGLLSTLEDADAEGDLAVYEATLRQYVEA